MTTTDHPYPVKLGGVTGSPYTRKMRAVLRYRRIPYQWVPRNSQWDDFAEVPVEIIPVLALPEPDGTYPTAMVDSSPQIMVLEQWQTGRSVVPTDPVVAFVDHLIEDYGDEWCTKMMFHYRWNRHHPAGINMAAQLLPLMQGLQVPEQTRQTMGKMFADRQIRRTALVGCTDENLPIVEASYRRLLGLLDRHLTEHPFVLGQRPGRGDFGIFGQFTQLTGWDPDAVALAVAEGPRCVVWTQWMDDMGWWEVDGDEGWFDRDGLASTVHELLAEIGRTYAPFMVANADAIRSGADEVTVEIDGHPYRQGPFPYQEKCLRWLDDAYQALSADDRAAVDRLLAGTGCEQLVAGA
ncbi:MAG: glutathione S-transferase N-terminal domain-containing protein [Acidimicrobiia bacterium]|nr:glutathione S-transferase N-terminal domain-containing protein [Acidimicrobiia bacterium]